MEFFDVIHKRRSIRRYTDKKVPSEVIEKALEAALLAPNSSNAQVWDFYWVQSEDKKKKLVQACLDQSAARTASDLLVVVASPTKWKRSWPHLIEFVKKVQAPKPVIMYYEKLFPYFYRWGFFNSFGLIKKVVTFCIGIFRPITRGPAFKSEIQMVAVKSAALASENFVLAIAAQGYNTCMMEGFDEWRVKKILNLKCSDCVVMVIGIGEEAERGTWGPRFRLPKENFIHRV